MKFWLSWWHDGENGEFELHSPWWVSGSRFVPGTTMDDLESEDCEMQDSICAAVIAENEQAAEELIFAAYDRRPPDIEFRFVEPRADDWTPFCDRFSKADWMEWPDAA